MIWLRVRNSSAQKRKPRGWEIQAGSRRPKLTTRRSPAGGEQFCTDWASAIMPQSGVYKARGAHPPMSQAPRPKPPRQTGGFLLTLSAAAHPPSSGPAAGLSAPTPARSALRCAAARRGEHYPPFRRGRRGSVMLRETAAMGTRLPQRSGPVSIMMASQCQCLRNAPPSFPNDRRPGTRRCAYRSPVYGAQCVRASWSLRTWDTVEG
jgi:hypothetical protein